MRAGTLPSSSTGKQGPMPDPVATRTTFLNSGAIVKTPEASAPRVHSLCGCPSIVLRVQSPAFDTTIEKPFWPGLSIAAKACHSRNGLSDMRIALPAIGVSKSKCSRIACLDKGSGRTATRLSLSQGSAILSVISAKSRLLGFELEHLRVTVFSVSVN